MTDRRLPPVSFPADPHTDMLPTISFDEVYHVGTLNQDDKRLNSYEGAGLSVSLHPHDWEYIARLGGNPHWVLTKPGNAFLCAHEIGRRLKSDILAWGIASGCAEECDVWRWRRIDDETGHVLNSFYAAEADAIAESFEDERQIGTVRRLAGHKSTPLLDQICLQTSQAIGTEDVLELLMPLYAEQILGLDGVWWNDRYAPYELSAPRGVICPTKLGSWARSNGTLNQLAA